MAGDFLRYTRLSSRALARPVRAKRRSSVKLALALWGVEGEALVATEALDHSFLGDRHGASLGDAVGAEHEKRLAHERLLVMVVL